MELENAIELLGTAKEGWPLTDVEQYYVALELGIEALKRIVHQRTPEWLGGALTELPGETTS